MKICKNGHSYDETIYSRCPQCDIEDDSATSAFTSNKRFKRGGVLEKDFVPNATDDNYASEGYLDSYIDDNDMKTVGLYKKVKGFDPVVGWLVCVDGASKGKDFIIKAERNFIGHDRTMDICITGDNTISAKKHAIISFNPKANTFSLFPGDSHGIIYLNDNEVISSERLKKGDIIQIGQTSLIFIPLCDEKFSW